MNVRERLMRLEARIRQKFCPNNKSGFIEALGLNPEDYKTAQGYDYKAAINSIAAETWADYKKEK